MAYNNKKSISKFLIVAFLLFLIPADTFNGAGNEKTGLKLIKEGEKLFRQYKYSESVDKFHEAEKYVKLEKNQSRLYLGISRSYYAMGLMAQVKEAINKLAMLSVKSSFKKSEYPRGYLKIYNKIQAEIEKKRREEQIAKAEEEKKRKDELIVKTEEEPERINQVKKTGEETTELTKKKDKTPEVKVEVKAKKTFAGVIEKSGKKKKKKKSLLLPIVLGAAALGAVAMLLGKKSDGSSNIVGSLVNIVTEPMGASVYIDDNYQSGNTNLEVNISPGSHVIRVVLEGWGEARTTYNFDHTKDYRMSVPIPGYKMVETGSLEIDSSVYYGDWDAGLNDGISTVSTQNGKYRLRRYEGEQHTLVLDKNLETQNGPVNKYIVVRYIESDDQLYVYNQNDRYLYIYDWDGNLISSHSGVTTSSVHTFDSSDDGNIYFITYDRSAVGSWTKDFSYNLGIVSGSKDNFYGLACSPIDNERFYIATNYNTNSIRATNTKGEGILWWDLENSDGYRVGGEIAAGRIGDGVAEKVFVEASVSNFSTSVLEVHGLWDEGGKLHQTYLTSTSTYPRISRIAADQDGTVYMETTKNHIIRLEPTGDPESNGEWTITETSNSNYSGYGYSGAARTGTTRINSPVNVRERRNKNRKRVKK